MNGDNRRFGALSSSVDPTQLSLTVESTGKILAGLIGWAAVAKGLDPATAQTQFQLIIDMGAQGIPIAFTLWNSMLVVWGAARKLLVLFFAR